MYKITILSVLALAFSSSLYAQECLLINDEIARSWTGGLTVKFKDGSWTKVQGSVELTEGEPLGTMHKTRGYSTPERGVIYFEWKHLDGDTIASAIIERGPEVEISPLERLRGQTFMTSFRMTIQDCNNSPIATIEIIRYSSRSSVFEFFSPTYVHRFEYGDIDWAGETAMSFPSGIHEFLQNQIQFGHPQQDVIMNRRNTDSNFNKRIFNLSDLNDGGVTEMIDWRVLVMLARLDIELHWVY